MRNERGNKGRGEKARKRSLSQRRCNIVYDIDGVKPRPRPQPCWIPFAAVDQNYKAERARSERVRSRKGSPRMCQVLQIPLFLSSSFVASRRKREQGRFENTIKIDSFVCPLFFGRNEKTNLLQIRLSSSLCISLRA